MVEKKCKKLEDSCERVRAKKKGKKIRAQERESEHNENVGCAYAREIDTERESERTKEI